MSKYLRGLLSLSLLQNFSDVAVAVPAHDLILQARGKYPLE